MTSMIPTSQDVPRLNALLNWWQSFARIISTKGALAVMDQAIVSVTNFVWIREIGRACSIGDLGDYYLAMTVLFVLVNVQSELITAPYTVYCHRKSGKSLDEYTGSVFAHQLIASLLAAVVFLIFLAATPLPVIGTSLTMSALTLILAGPFWLMRGFLRYMSFARMQCGAAVVMDTIACALQLGGLWLMLRNDVFALHWAFALMGGSSALVVGGWFLLRPIPIARPKSLVRDFRENWGFAKWALLSQMVGCMTPYIFPWLLKSLKGRVSAGLMGAANTICGIAVIFSLGIVHLLTPIASRAYVQGGKAALIKVLVQTGIFLLATVGCFAFVATFFGEQVMVFVYDGRFSGVGSTLSILSLAVLANCLSITCGNGLWAIDRPKYNLYADAVALLTTLVAAFLLVGPHGPLGAAWATLIGNTCGAVTRFGIFCYAIRNVEPVPHTSPEPPTKTGNAS
jgi:O-antigen/teichoic acid export membrane protein